MIRRTIAAANSASKLTLMKIVAGLKAAAKALVSGPPAESFRVAGKPVTCPHCGNTLFRRRKASLNTAASSATSTEWADREACALVCANCSRIEWFYDDVKPERDSRPSRAESPSGGP